MKITTLGRVLLPLALIASACSGSTTTEDDAAASEDVSDSNGVTTDGADATEDGDGETDGGGDGDPADTDGGAPADRAVGEFPQPTSVSTETSFLDEFDGDPSEPTPWMSADWDVTIHSRDWSTWEQLEPMELAHGPDCSPPPNRHTGTEYRQAVFNCKNHVMTAINAGGYAMIYLTPNHMVDFSAGESVINFDMSTQRFSARDWADVWITPYEKNIQLVLNEDIPDGNGTPQNGIQVEMVENIDINATRFDLRIFRDGVLTQLDGRQIGYESFLTPDEKKRETFELVISKNRIRFGLPEYDLWWIDTALDLDWDQGVVQFGHHSYNPYKACNEDGTCGPGSWHWDNISIAPSKPFTIIQSDVRAIGDVNGVDGEGVVNFASPAPADAHLRFAGFGDDLEVSYDGRGSWEKAQLQEQVLDPDGGVFVSYWTPIPEGVQQVHVRGKGGPIGPFHARDFTIWAR